MCAINGIAGPISKEEHLLVERMNAATRHRGPDSTQTFFNDNVALGFNRLAIIDLSKRAMQPMTDASGRFTIVYNGEIYNYRELKKELSEYPFTSESDTEVILAAFGRWGEAAFSKLNGMFALALWDREEKRLVVARDPVGIKPLYYSVQNGRLIFSSEIKAILETGMPRTLNQEALGHYLRLMYVPAPLSMFNGVQKLLPGHVLTFQNGTHTVTPFRGKWAEAVPSQSYSEAKERVKKSVEEAVTRQLMSDRPVGVYLSGGIDSSIVLASASNTHPAIDTFSIGFELGDGEEFEKFNADAMLAKRTAAHFGANHHEFALSSKDVLALFSETVRQLDEPIGNATALAQVFLARQVKPIATVVLTGDGGDELFGGYERYRLSLLAEQYGRFLPQFISPRAHLSGVDRFAQLMFQKDTDLRPLFTDAFSLPDTRALFLRDFTSGATTKNLLRADETHWLVDEALTRGDKTSMIASVEARVPLLDLEVRALAHSLPLAYTVTPFTTKRILKDAFAGIVPAEVRTAPKRGWFSPGAKWLRHDNFIRHANVAFTPEYAPGVSPLFDFPYIRGLWEAHREKRSYHYTLLYATLAFLEWAREYKVSL